MKELIGKDLSFIPIEEWNKLNEEERKKIMYAAPRPIWVRLRELHAKVNNLVDFINILGKVELKYF